MAGQFFSRMLNKAFLLPNEGRLKKLSRSCVNAFGMLLIVGLLGVGGCASAPVQEMSNARQAIRAAQDAGAAQYAPKSLREAKALLSDAESALQRREFRQARRKASEAHTKAAEALRAAEARTTE